MTRDGVVLENQATGEEINISDREAEQDFSAPETGGTAEKVLERADRGRERRAEKKAAKQARAVQTQDGGTSRPSSRLQFSEEERATPELKKYIRKSDQRADRLDAARAAIPKEDPQGSREDQGKDFRRGQRQGQGPCAPGNEGQAAPGHETQSGQPPGSGSFTVHPRESP